MERGSSLIPKVDMTERDRIILVRDEEGNTKATLPFDESLIEMGRMVNPNGLVCKKVSEHLIGIDYEYYERYHGNKGAEGDS